jgi:hypothetical protein
MSEKNGSRKYSIASLLQNAVDLKVHCETDKEQLIAAGLSWHYYDELLEWTVKAQKLYIQIMLYREDCKCATKALETFASTCSDLRTDMREILISAMELFQVKTKIPGMSQKKAYIDISQDLLQLAVTGEKLMKKVPECNLEKEVIEKARSYSKELFYMASGSKMPYPPVPHIKQNFADAVKALTIVTQQIRKIGKIAFRSNPGRRRAYLS